MRSKIIVGRGPSAPNGTSTRTLTVLCAMLAAITVAACGDDPDQLTGRGSKPTGGGEGEAENGEVTPETLQCTEKPSGRSYAHFDGSKLEAQRMNENVGVNRARIKPYAVMAGEYQRVLGTVPPSLAGAAGSFDDPPSRWYAEATHSGVSLNAIFDISFEGCSAYVKSGADFAAAPTKESAGKVCTSLMRKAWSRSASPDEIDDCVELATQKLASEPDVRRKWTYVCASILSSSHFLTF